ncbi:ABC transporter ATP-binding protein [Asanoa sp. NPDC049573]|uniref:ABC transporter ATP-binding protein n=1 Tax=Asanoa sp. NPDC049573 TaxID=3155396 RepID=UPI003447E85A
MAVLEVVDVVRRFGGKHAVTALQGFSMTVEAGEIVGLLGVNGAGKTTLVKIVATLLQPTSGTARVCGYDVTVRGRDARTHLGVVFGGDRGLYGRLSAVDNLIFFGGLAGIRRGLRRRAMEALEHVGLADRAGTRVETLSRGMRQRLHLAAGLLHQPRLLLLDEPTTGLDVVEAQRMRDHVAGLARTGVAVLLTSHYPVDVDQLANRVVVLQDGINRNDLPIARFRELAGFVAEVRITGTGPQPRGGDGQEIVATADGWTMTCRLHRWDAATLAMLTEITKGYAVTDLQVTPVGLEGVLHSLLGGRG